MRFFVSKGKMVNGMLLPGLGNCWQSVKLLWNVAKAVPFLWMKSQDVSVRVEQPDHESDG